MTFTYDLATDIGRVRALITDTVSATANFTDEELTALLALVSGDVFLGAATALDTLAVRVALAQGKVRLPDLEVDGTALAKVLSERAKSLREQADETGASDEVEFDWSQPVHSPFGYSEHLWNERLRGGV